MTDAVRGSNPTAYLALSIGGVQDFISDSRSTGDVWAASQLMSDLSREVARAIDSNGGKVLMPVASSSGVPNRIWAEITAGNADDVARQAAAKAVKWWSDLERPSA